ncbi:acyl-CoA synthetase [Saccharopolyspora sp. NFXS83]|uniref:acyl-CoA synthetase n=1 Tax=Saccharopolyspora sp. NFXS83 TaxID=2993560 RepID=UPI00224A6399|nr:acyl-CoA synthetase [Saccharopolyspora sp. NFXS83]MCX2730423.1 acyl-CoA synthetase [Saccharopolyspora sp. NFXS83]
MAHNIADLFEHAVDLTPERVAVICGEDRVTFAELERRSNRLAHHWAQRGLGRGSHIGVHTRNRIEALEAMLAAYKLRAVAVNINYRYVAEELRYIYADADLAALVHERRYGDRVAEALPPGLRSVLVLDDGSDQDCTAHGGTAYEAALADSSPERDFPARSDDDLFLLYTGGTTGNPKGVMWRHEDVWRTLGGGIDFMTGEPMADEWQQARDGAASGGLVRLPAAPFIHGAAQWAAFGNLFACSTVVILPEFDAHETWRAIEDHGVNVLAITGDAMARPLIEALHEGSYDVSSLVAISSSAALFSPSVQEQYLEALPNVVLTDSIGSSETGFSGIGVLSKGGARTGGPRVKADSATAIIGPDGRLLATDSGEVGLLARSGHVPLGYYKDPDKSGSVFVEIDGVRYVVPGDYARYESDGTVTMLGRGSMSVNTGGEKVYPEEVEGVLKAHPDVFDALVFGVPDERLGQCVAAVVQTRDGTEPAWSELEAHARKRIAGYKVPRKLWLAAKVRRSPSGKPDYRWACTHAEQHEPDAVKHSGTAAVADAAERKP